MQLLHSILKVLHLREYFYTGTAHGARNKYQVCADLKMYIFRSLPGKGDVYYIIQNIVSFLTCINFV